MAHENVIEMRDITKVFGEFVANDKINLHLRKGEIHALLGENGAGKSTLMNMLAGLLEPTSGEIVVNGQVVNLDSPSKAASLGIGMVHQHFMLVEAFTVAENIILGSEVTNKGVLDLKKANADILELSEKLCFAYGYSRVDFLLSQDHVYFSEITLTPNAGRMVITPVEWDLKLGALWRSY